MKWLMLFTLLVSQLSLAETLQGRKNKEAMLKRVDTLIEKSTKGREEVERQDMEAACEIIEDMFKIMPDHLMAIGTKMDLFDRDVIRIENESKMFLIDLHKRSNICKSSDVPGDNLEIKDTEKQFKKMKKAFEKQKKKIKKSDTDYNNSYSYYYEFN